MSLHLVQKEKSLSDYYTEKIRGFNVLVEKNGQVYQQWNETDYFIKNDRWFMVDLRQMSPVFKEDFAGNKANNSVIFRFINNQLNLEMKYVTYTKLFAREWSGGLANVNRYFKHIAWFMNERYPHINSLLDLDLEPLMQEYIQWLEVNGVKDLNDREQYETGKIFKERLYSTHLSKIYRHLFKELDTREEWAKDIWDVRNLHSKYGIEYNESNSCHYLHFDKIKNKSFKENFKAYIKKRLLGRNKFSIGSAFDYTKAIHMFFNYISEKEPVWPDLKNLARPHIESYIEYLNIYVTIKLTSRNANPNRYINRNLTIVGRFLSDIQLYEWDFAPEKEVRKLFHPGDKPKEKKKPYDQIDYVPDHVLDQLMRHFNHLSKDAQPVVLLMLYTGLRISDVLELTWDCLLKINGKYWIQANVEKTYVEGHRIPIDEKTASLVAVLIDESKKISNNLNNPRQLVFCRYKGSRTGKPFTQRGIQGALGRLAKERNITDESGKLWHFNNHSFRHTYAVRLINNNVDLVVVQELLAHATPEMTLVYAKIVDDTKRKAFEIACRNGAFSFDTSGNLKEDDLEQKLNEAGFKWEWISYKLSAINNPYGICLQRLNGKCNYSLQPPCLTCNNGKPCNDLLVLPDDAPKYEVLIDSAKTMINRGLQHDRNDWVESNQQMLDLYEYIYSKIKEGTFIFGRRNRLAAEGGGN